MIRLVFPVALPPVIGVELGLSIAGDRRLSLWLRMGSVSQQRTQVVGEIVFDIRPATRFRVDNTP